MIFGNAAWGFRETPLEKQLEITSQMGLKVLELGIANAPMDLPLNISDDEIENVKALFAKYNVEALCAATGNDFTNGNYDDVDKVKRVTDICSKIGIKYLRIFAGFSPVDEVTGSRWSTMTDCLNMVYDYAETKDVVLTVETHGGVNDFEDGVEHFYSTSTKPDTILKMLSDVPKMRMNYDPSNLYAVGIKNPEAVYEKIKDRVECVHLKDFVTLPSGHLLPAACGESEMDWKAIIKSLSGFKGPALFEYENVGDIANGCKRCYNYINNVMIGE